MEAWILGLSCFQRLNQISNMLGSLKEQNTMSKAVYKRGVGQRFSTVAAHEHQLGDLKNTQAPKPAPEIQS